MSIEDPLGNALEALGVDESTFRENLLTITKQVRQGKNEIVLGEDRGGERVVVTLRSAKELLSYLDAQAKETDQQRTERLLARWDGSGQTVELNRQVKTDSDILLAAWAQGRW